MVERNPSYLQIHGIVSGILSGIIFLFVHEFTISDIWYSSPFILVISAISGYFLVEAYFTIYESYEVNTWIVYCLHFVIGLFILSGVSILIYTPKVTSAELINAAGPVPSYLMIEALPLVIFWTISTTSIFIYYSKTSKKNFLIMLIPSTIIYLTLGLNLSVLGKVQPLHTHQYLVTKFMLLNLLLGVSFLLVFVFLRYLSNTVTIAKINQIIKLLS